MSKSLDTLAKNLASGMSRRKAIWQFITGLGALGALSSRQAYANEPDGVCRDFCREQAEIFKSLCIEASQQCERGTCAELSLLTGGSLQVNGGGYSLNGSPFICVPVTE